MTTRHRRTGRRVSSRLVLYAISALVLAALVAAWVPNRRQGGAPAGSSGQAAGIADASVRAISSASAAPTPQAAAEASLRLQALLGQHTVLAAHMMRSRVRGDPDLAQAANAALGKTTDAMGELVQALFGAQAKTKFTTMWAAHITALFNYARGLADHDAGVRAQAQATIATFENDLAAFFAGASQGRLSSAAARAAIQAHITHLEGQANAYAAGNYAQADQIYREGYSHAFGLGKVLASTLLPPAAAKEVDTPTWRLRSALDQMLGEHVVVVIAAMRAGVTNAPDFSAAAATLNANTRDLAGAMSTLFGSAAGARFQALWANHVDALLSYTAGVVKNDTTQRNGARSKLGSFEEQFASFVGAATKNQMRATTLAGAFRMHDEMLLQEADAFGGKDYVKAHDLAYTSYQEMFTLAGKLSDAFGVTVAARLPLGAVQTGRGGMATVVERRRNAG